EDTESAEENTETLMQVDKEKELSTQPIKGSIIESVVAKQFGSRDLVSSRDLSAEEVNTILSLTGLIKARPAEFSRSLAGKQVVMFFEKPSLRTRLTFEAAMASMGGVAFFVDQREERLGTRETLADVAHNVERWVNGMVLRTFSHATIEDMAAHA